MTSPHRVFIFGDSHAQPLVNALAERSFVDEAGNDCVFANMVDCGLISLDLLIESKDRSDMLNPILQRAMETGGLMNRFTSGYSPENASVGLLFGYADVHMLGFVKRFFEGFDAGLLGEGPRAASGAVHYAMLRALIRQRLEKVDKTVAFLTRLGFSVFLAAAPPPSRDEVIGAHHPSVDAPAAGARLAVWQAVQEVTAEIAARHGARLLTDQTRFADADGFLRPAYVADGVHANAEHGLAYLADIVAGLGLALTPVPRHPVKEAPPPEPPPPEIEPPVAEVPPEPARKRGFARSVAQAFTRLR